jgi:hypothetical protein
VVVVPPLPSRKGMYPVVDAKLNNFVIKDDGQQ